MIIKVYHLFIVLFVLYGKFASSSFLLYEEGDECDIKRSHRTCQNVKKCPTEAEAVRKGLEPDICGLRQSQLVCCSKTLKKSISNKKYLLMKEEASNKKKHIIKRAAPGEKSKRMCQKYSESVYSFEEPQILLPGATKVKVDNCGIRETPLIVGGELARAKEFPHMALIGHSEKDDESAVINWQCGGSLISERWIVSAAHCTATRRGLAKWATLGDLKVLSEEDEDYTDPVTLRIVERVDHPDYHSGRGYNDIALYKLERDVKFNAYIRPICLNTDTRPYSGKAIASGWGNTKWKGSSSQDLLRVVLNLHDMNDCDNAYKNAQKPGLLIKTPQGISPHNLVCAWERGKDTCQVSLNFICSKLFDKLYCIIYNEAMYYVRRRESILEIAKVVIGREISSALRSRESLSAGSPSDGMIVQLLQDAEDKSERNNEFFYMVSRNYMTRRLDEGIGTGVYWLRTGYSEHWSSYPASKSRGNLRSRNMYLVQSQRKY